MFTLEIEDGREAGLESRVCSEKEKSFRIFSHFV